MEPTRVRKAANVSKSAAWIPGVTAPYGNCKFAGAQRETQLERTSGWHAEAGRAKEHRVASAAIRVYTRSMRAARDAQGCADVRPPVERRRVVSRQRPAKLRGDFGN
jgi:hypothetical protein